MKAIEKDDNVKLHYKGTLSNGEIFDSSEGRDPLAFTAGGGQVIPGFDAAIMGMKAEESKTFTIPSGEAYGEVREELVHQVERSSIPAELNPEVGQRLVSNLQDGRQIPVVVTAVTEDKITLDANHPLAGKDLTFEITIVSVD